MDIQSEIARRHEKACRQGQAFYIDPATGYSVMTAHQLRKRGDCCGCGCRHCPYDAETQRRAGRPES